MIDPLGHQTPSLIDRGFRVVDAVQGGAGLEGRHIVGADVAKLTIGGNHGAFAPPADLTSLRHFLDALLSCEPFAYGRSIVSLVSNSKRERPVSAHIARRRVGALNARRRVGR